MDPVSSSLPKVCGIKRCRVNDPLFQATVSASKKLKLDPNYMNGKKVCRLQSSPLSKVVKKEIQIIPDPADFHINLGQSLQVEDQGYSGNCMLIAVLNFIKRAIHKKYGVSDFRLSKNYLLYYNCMVKARQILSGSFDKSAMIEEGFDFSELSFLIQRYGVVPYESMPDNYHTTDPSEFYYLINYFIRQTLVGERSAAMDIEKTLARFAELLMKFLGPVPESVSVRFGKIRKNTSPRSFLTTVFPEFAFSDIWTAVIKDKSRISSSKGNTLYLKMDDFVQGMVNALKGGCPIIMSYFYRYHSDIHYSGKNKIKSLKISEYLGLPKGEDRKITKHYWKYAELHAVLIIGVHFDEKKRPKYWLFENSYGNDHGLEGYNVVPHQWLVDCVCEMFIPSQFLDHVSLDS